MSEILNKDFNTESSSEQSKLSEKKSNQERRYDSRLRGKITRVFDGWIAEQEKYRKQEQDETEEYHEMFDEEILILRSAEAELRRLTYNEAKIKPQDISVGLGVLLSHIAYYDFKLDDEEGQQVSRRREESLQLFKKIGDIIYKDANMPSASKESFLHSVRISRFKSEDEISILSRALQDGDNEALLNQIDEILDNLDIGAGGYAKSVAKRILDQHFLYGESEKSASGEISKIAFQVYKLEKMRDELREKIYGRHGITREEIKQIEATRTTIDKAEPLSLKISEDELARRRAELMKLKITRGTSEQKESTIEKENKKYFGFAKELVFDLGKEGSFGILENDQRIDDIRQSVTPQMKEQFLNYLLQSVDYGIEGAQKYLKNSGENGIVGRKGVAHFLGAIAEKSPIYQKMYFIGSNKVLTPTQIAQMPMKDYLKAFGYDIEQDKERADLLRKYTNALD